MEKNAKIYVAGHRGMVGSAIVRELNRQGYTNIITRTHQELDLTRQADVEDFFAAEKPEYVFLAAAKVGGIIANQNALADFMWFNMTLEMNVINSAWKNGCKKLEFLGSSCIYPRMAPQPMKEDCLLTSELEKTNEAYALAKISGLKYCEFLNKQYGTDYISVMPTNLYGPNDNYHPTHSHVLPALIKVASHKEEDGYHFDPPTTLGIIFGEPSAPFDSERVKAVEELFADTGIHFRSTEYIQEEIWCKFCLNVCSNLPQAILGAGVGCYRDSVHMKAISDGLKRELEAVAQAKGIDMSKTESSSGRGSAVPPSARYSTLQDLDAGCHTEIDMFSGALVRMGKELGIPMPYNEYTYHMIKALEEKNDGKFNYTGKEELTWSK
mgnify:CR=1 FL=1